MPIRTYNGFRRKGAVSRTYRKTNLRRFPRFESLEARLILRADLIISEILAANVDGLIDFQGKDSDWFEIHNRGTTPVDLNGWYVSDDAVVLTKWQFLSSAVLESDDRVVVHASGQDLEDPNGVFHTNFRLDADGEFLALVDPSGIVIDSFSPRFPTQTINVSYGIEENLSSTVYSFSDVPTQGR